MKKNSKKVDMQKPKIGECYKLFGDEYLHKKNVLKVIRIPHEEDVVIYINLDKPEYEYRWNYKEFPDCLKRKLTNLEVELL